MVLVLDLVVALVVVAVEVVVVVVVVGLVCGGFTSKSGMEGVEDHGRFSVWWIHLKVRHGRRAAHRRK